MRLTKDYQAERIAGQQVLLPAGHAVIEGGMVYSLNDTAAWVIRALDEDISFEELLCRAARHFQADTEAEKETLRADLDGFCRELREKGLLDG